MFCPSKRGAFLFVNPQNYFLSLEKTNPSSPSHDHVHVHGGLAL